MLPVAIVEELGLSLNYATGRYRGGVRLSLNSSTTATGSSNLWLVPDAVDTVICAADDGWRDHPKHVEQFTDKINCV